MGLAGLFVSPSSQSSQREQERVLLGQSLRESGLFGGGDASCQHQFKLVESKIFSSGKFQVEHAQLQRDILTSRANSTGSLRSGGSSSNLLQRRTDSVVSSENDPWGWFEDVETDALHDEEHGLGAPPAFERHDGMPAVKETPQYILMESLSSQKLWHQTAGRRPRQPSREREFFEKQWQKNFSQSEVDYTAPLEAAALGMRDGRKGNKAGQGQHMKRVLYRASSPFGSAVSKSFKCDNCGEISSIMVHVPKFQIAQAGSDVHAEYLIVVGLGNVTLGVWRRFSEFKRLADRISNSSRRKQFHNALCSWRILQNRQRWFRCLDRDYLVLKCFLLERFLHDLVFESLSPDTVREFLGVL